MSVASEITRIQGAKAALKAAINGRHGLAVLGNETIDDYAAAVFSLPSPARLAVGATTVRKTASTTENYASNDNIRILGSDNHKYTLAEWNALFVEAGYDTAQMAVTPKGISIDAFGIAGECLLFDRYTGVVYNTVGDSAADAGCLQHSLLNHMNILASSGTDYTTGKAWSVTKDGDEWVLYEANTKRTWRTTYNGSYAKVFAEVNNLEVVDYMCKQTEWMRHRMAISSGITTANADGTMGEIAILNASGAQAAVGEDMYFWIKNDSDQWVTTGLLAKYNENNRHYTNFANLTAAIATAIYDRQKANGINMNDTGVNSASKPVLAPGSKGAEVIAVDGVWMIITPFINSPNATTSNVLANFGDSPACYWAKSKGYALPTDTLLEAAYLNATVVSAIYSYLNTVESRGFDGLASNYAWTAFRASATACHAVTPNSGLTIQSATTYRYFIYGSIYVN